MDSYTEGALPAGECAPDAGIRLGRALGLLAARLVPWVLVASLLVGLGGCSDATGPSQPPYIAIVNQFSAAPGTDIGSVYTYRVTEISGLLHIDKHYTAGPYDTIIVPVKPATYKITMSGAPRQCRYQGGTEFYLLVPENSNTALVRNQISCQSLITVSTATDGSMPDAAYIYHLTGPLTDRSGILNGNDTLRIDQIPPGTYTVDLGHVAGNCVVTNDGGSRLSFTIADSGGTAADFRISCSEEAARPRVLFFQSSYHQGASGFLLKATDPDRDIERYYWDITDCAGKSVLPTGGRLRRGLTQGPTSGLDTITVFGAIELGLPDASLQGKCTSIRVADEYGNTTPVVEEPIGNEASGPVPTQFNSQFINTAQLATTMQVADPTFAGVFLAATLRDGVLFPPDGQPDIGVYNAVGYSDLLLPTVPLGGGRPPYYDYYSVIAYVFDIAGNFTRLEDNDLFH